MQNRSVPLPSHGQIMAGQSPHSTESTCPAEKAWHHTIRHGAPLQLHVFDVSYNDFSLSPSQNRAFRMVFFPCILLLQCVLTRKTCHALSSLGVILICAALHGNHDNELKLPTNENNNNMRTVKINTNKNESK
jgi:hypothetical protein